MPPKKPQRGQNLRGKSKLFHHDVMNVRVGLGHAVVGRHTITLLVDRLKENESPVSDSAFRCEIFDVAMKGTSSDISALKKSLDALCLNRQIMLHYQQKIAKVLLQALTKNTEGEGYFYYLPLVLAFARDLSTPTAEPIVKGRPSTMSSRLSFLPYFDLFFKALMRGMYDSKTGGQFLSQTDRLQLVFGTISAMLSESLSAAEHEKDLRKQMNQSTMMTNNNIIHGQETVNNEDIDRHVRRILTLVIKTTFSDSKEYIRRLGAEVLASVCRRFPHYSAFVFEYATFRAQQEKFIMPISAQNGEGDDDNDDSDNDVDRDEDKSTVDDPSRHVSFNINESGDEDQSSSVIEGDDEDNKGESGLNNDNIASDVASPTSKAVSEIFNSKFPNGTNSVHSSSSAAVIKTIALNTVLFAEDAESSPYIDTLTYFVVELLSSIKGSLSTRFEWIFSIMLEDAGLMHNVGVSAGGNSNEMSHLSISDGAPLERFHFLLDLFAKNSITTSESDHQTTVTNQLQHYQQRWFAIKDAMTVMFYKSMKALTDTLLSGKTHTDMGRILRALERVLLSASSQSMALNANNSRPIVDDCNVSNDHGDVDKRRAYYQEAPILVVLVMLKGISEARNHSILSYLDISQLKDENDHTKSVLDQKKMKTKWMTGNESEVSSDPDTHVTIGFDRIFKVLTSHLKALAPTTVNSIHATKTTGVNKDVIVKPTNEEKKKKKSCNITIFTIEVLARICYVMEPFLFLSSYEEDRALEAGEKMMKPLLAELGRAVQRLLPYGYTPHKTGHQSLPNGPSVSSTTNKLPAALIDPAVLISNVVRFIQDVIQKAEAHRKQYYRHHVRGADPTSDDEEGYTSSFANATAMTVLPCFEQFYLGEALMLMQMVGKGSTYHSQLHIAQSDDGVITSTTTGLQDNASSTTSTSYSTPKMDMLVLLELGRSMNASTEEDNIEDKLTDSRDSDVKALGLLNLVLKLNRPVIPVAVAVAPVPFPISSKLASAKTLATGVENVTPAVALASLFIADLVSLQQLGERLTDLANTDKEDCRNGPLAGDDDMPLANLQQNRTDQRDLEVVTISSAWLSLLPTLLGSCSEPSLLLGAVKGVMRSLRAVFSTSSTSISYPALKLGTGKTPSIFQYDPVAKGRLLQVFISASTIMATSTLLVPSGVNGCDNYVSHGDEEKLNTGPEEAVCTLVDLINTILTTVPESLKPPHLYRPVNTNHIDPSEKNEDNSGINTGKKKKNSKGAKDRHHKHVPLFTNLPSFAIDGAVETLLFALQRQLPTLTHSASLRTTTANTRSFYAAPEGRILENPQLQFLLFHVLGTSRSQKVRLCALNLLEQCYMLYVCRNVYSNSTHEISNTKEADQKKKGKTDDTSRIFQNMKMIFPVVYPPISATETSIDNADTNVEYDLDVFRQLRTSEGIDPMTSGDLNAKAAALTKLTFDCANTSNFFNRYRRNSGSFMVQLVVRSMLGVFHVKFAPIWTVATRIIANILKDELVMRREDVDNTNATETGIRTHEGDVVSDYSYKLWEHLVKPLVEKSAFASEPSRPYLRGGTSKGDVLGMKRESFRQGEGGFDPMQNVHFLFPLRFDDNQLHSSGALVSRGLAQAKDISHLPSNRFVHTLAEGILLHVEHFAFGGSGERGSLSEILVFDDGSSNMNGGGPNLLSLAASNKKDNNDSHAVDVVSVSKSLLQLMLAVSNMIHMALPSARKCFIAHGVLSSSPSRTADTPSFETLQDQLKQKGLVWFVRCHSRTSQRRRGDEKATDIPPVFSVPERLFLELSEVDNGNHPAFKGSSLPPLSNSAAEDDDDEAILRSMITGGHSKQSTTLKAIEDRLELVMVSLSSQYTHQTHYINTVYTTLKKGTTTSIDEEAMLVPPQQKMRLQLLTDVLFQYLSHQNQRLQSCAIECLKRMSVAPFATYSEKLFPFVGGRIVNQFVNSKSVQDQSTTDKRTFSATSSKRAGQIDNNNNSNVRDGAEADGRGKVNRSNSKKQTGGGNARDALTFLQTFHFEDEISFDDRAEYVTTVVLLCLPKFVASRGIGGSGGAGKKKIRDQEVLARRVFSFLVKLDANGSGQSSKHELLHKDDVSRDKSMTSGTNGRISFVVDLLLSRILGIEESTTSRATIKNRQNQNSLSDSTSNGQSELLKSQKYNLCRKVCESALGKDTLALIEQQKKEKQFQSSGSAAYPQPDKEDGVDYDSAGEDFDSNFGDVEDQRSVDHQSARGDDNISLGGISGNTATRLLGVLPIARLRRRYETMLKKIAAALKLLTQLTPAVGAEFGPYAASCFELVVQMFRVSSTSNIVSEATIMLPELSSTGVFASSATAVSNVGNVVFGRQAIRQGTVIRKLASKQLLALAEMFPEGISESLLPITVGAAVDSDDDDSEPGCVASKEEQELCRIKALMMASHFHQFLREMLANTPANQLQNSMTASALQGRGGRGGMSSPLPTCLKMLQTLVSNRCFHPLLLMSTPIRKLSTNTVNSGLLAGAVGGREQLVMAPGGSSPTVSETFMIPLLKKCFDLDSADSVLVASLHILGTLVSCADERILITINNPQLLISGSSSSTSTTTFRDTILKQFGAQLFQSLYGVVSQSSAKVLETQPIGHDNNDTVGTASTSRKRPKSSSGPSVPVRIWKDLVMIATTLPQFIVTSESQSATDLSYRNYNSSVIPLPTMMGNLLEIILQFMRSPICATERLSADATARMIEAVIVQMPEGIKLHPTLHFRRLVNLMNVVTAPDARLSLSRALKVAVTKLHISNRSSNLHTLDSKQQAAQLEVTSRVVSGLNAFMVDPEAARLISSKEVPETFEEDISREVHTKVKEIRENRRKGQKSGRDGDNTEEFDQTINSEELDNTKIVDGASLLLLANHTKHGYDLTKYDFERRYHTFNSLTTFFNRAADDISNTSSSDKKHRSHVVKRKSGAIDDKSDTSGHPNRGMTIRNERVFDGEHDVDLFNVVEEHDLLCPEALMILAANLLFFIRDHETTIRNFAVESLGALLRYCGAVTDGGRTLETEVCRDKSIIADEEILDGDDDVDCMNPTEDTVNSSKAEEMSFGYIIIESVIRGIILPTLRKGIAGKNTQIRGNHMGGLGFLARSFPTLYPSLAALYSLNAEQNFFSCIRSPHHRVRMNALGIIRKKAATGAISYREVLRVYIPFLTAHLKDFAQGKHSNKSDQDQRSAGSGGWENNKSTSGGTGYDSVTEGKSKGFADSILVTLAALCKGGPTDTSRMPWEGFHHVLKTLLKEATQYEHLRAIMLKGVVQLLDVFDYLEEATEEEEKGAVREKRGKNVRGATKQAPPISDVTVGDAPLSPEAQAKINRRNKIINSLEVDFLKTLYSFILTEKKSRVKNPTGGNINESGKAGFGSTTSADHGGLSTHFGVKSGEGKKENRTVVQLPVAVAILKVIRYFPSHRFDYHVDLLLSEVILKLRTKNDRQRESARKILCSMMNEAGPKKLKLVVVRLRDQLVHGYQLHVLGYTLVSLLQSMFGFANEEGDNITVKDKGTSQPSIDNVEKKEDCDDKDKSDKDSSESDSSSSEDEGEDDSKKGNTTNSVDDENQKKKSECNASGSTKSHRDELRKAMKAIKQGGSTKKIFNLEESTKALDEVLPILFDVFLDDYLGEIGEQKEQTELMSTMVEVKRNKSIQGFMFLSIHCSGDKVMQLFMRRIRWMLAPPSAQELLKQQVGGDHVQGENSRFLLGDKKRSADARFVERVRVMANRVAKGLTLNRTLSVADSLKETLSMLQDSCNLRDAMIRKFEAKDGTRRIRGNIDTHIDPKKLSRKELQDKNFVVMERPDRIDVDFSSHTVLATQHKQKLKVYKGKYAKDLKSASKSFHLEDKETAVVLDTLDDFSLKFLLTLLKKALGSDSRGRERTLLPSTVVVTETEGVEGETDEGVNDEGDTTQDDGGHDDIMDTFDDATAIETPEPTNASSSKSTIQHETSRQTISQKFAAQYTVELNSILPLVVSVLQGEGSDDVVTSSLEVLHAFICLHPPLNSICTHGQVIFDILADLLSREGDIKQKALRVMSNLISHKFFALTHQQSVWIVSVVKGEIIEGTHLYLSMALQLLLSVVNRRVEIPEIYDIIAPVTEVLVQKAHILMYRSRCISIISKFLGEYRVSMAKFRSHIDLYVQNLQFPNCPGRMAMLDLVGALVVRLPYEIVRRECSVLFVPLVHSMTSAPWPKCQERAAAVIQSLVVHAGVDIIAKTITGWMSVESSKKTNTDHHEDDNIPKENQKSTRTIFSDNNGKVLELKTTALQCIAVILPTLPQLYSVAVTEAEAASLSESAVRERRETLEAAVLWCIPHINAGLTHQHTVSKNRKNMLLKEVTATVKARNAKKKNKAPKEGTEEEHTKDILTEEEKINMALQTKLAEEADAESWRMSFFSLRAAEALGALSPLFYSYLGNLSASSEEYNSQATCDSNIIGPHAEHKQDSVRPQSCAMEAVCRRYLQHPHVWVRNAATRVVYGYFALFAHPRMSTVLEATNKDVKQFYCCPVGPSEKPGTLHHLSVKELKSVTKQLLQLIAGSDVQDELHLGFRAIDSPQRTYQVEACVTTFSLMGAMIIQAAVLCEAQSTENSNPSITKDELIDTFVMYSSVWSQALSMIEPIAQSSTKSIRGYLVRSASMAQVIPRMLAFRTYPVVSSSISEGLIVRAALHIMSSSDYGLGGRGAVERSIVPFLGICAGSSQQSLRVAEFGLNAVEVLKDLLRESKDDMANDRMVKEVSVLSELSSSPLQMLAKGDVAANTANISILLDIINSTTEAVTSPPQSKKRRGDSHAPVVADHIRSSDIVLQLANISDSVRAAQKAEKIRALHEKRAEKERAAKMSRVDGKGPVNNNGSAFTQRMTGGKKRSRYQ